MNNKAILTITEVAALTGFSEQTLYKWARMGFLPSKQFNRSIRFDPVDVDAFIKDANRKTPPMHKQPRRRR